MAFQNYPLISRISRVYRREVVARRFRSVLVRRSHCVRLMPAVLGFCLASLCLAACGGSEVSTSTTTSPSPATNTIISAWFAAQRAFDAAAIDSDAHSPRLAATMISPQLEHVRENLQTFASLGYGARGPTYFGKPKVRDQSRGPSPCCVMRSRGGDRDRHEDGQTRAWRPGPKRLRAREFGDASDSFWVETCKPDSGCWRMLRLVKTLAVVRPIDDGRPVLCPPRQLRT